jgi:PGF-CTERM protein
VRKAIYARFFTIGLFNNYVKKIDHKTEGISVKWIGIILMAIVAIAFIIPQTVAAQVVGIQTVTVSGAVYSGALPISGAKVSLLTWDGKTMGQAIKTGTTSDGSVNPKGYFQFNNVPFDTNKSFNYVIEAEKDDATAFAMVHVVAVEAAGQKAIAEPIYLDFGMDSWVSDLTGTVQSANIEPLGLVQGATVTLYAVDPSTGQTAKVEGSFTNPATTDARGGYEFTNLPYGFYKVDVVKNNYIESTTFTVFQQETHVNTIISGLIMQITPTPIPGQKPSSGLPFGIPGFGVAAMLIAFVGAAYFVSRRKN